MHVKSGTSRTPASLLDLLLSVSRSSETICVIESVTKAIGVLFLRNPPQASLITSAVHRLFSQLIL